ncbi:protein [Escherichia coli]|uniref:Protein n=1 Tax=Escherichia coli TaxID=562 RepID=A0A376MWW9_ECOLX|nr:protein [Escherichia coli]
MFPEYRDLISRLKNENPRFMSLFDKHNKLDHEIARKKVPTVEGTMRKWSA